jgi:hypothetical protein
VSAVERGVIKSLDCYVERGDKRALKIKAADRRLRAADAAVLAFLRGET